MLGVDQRVLKIVWTVFLFALAVPRHFVVPNTQQWNLIFAGAVLAALPMIGIFLLLQRSFLKSFAGVLTGSA